MLAKTELAGLFLLTCIIGWIQCSNVSTETDSSEISGDSLRTTVSNNPNDVKFYAFSMKTDRVYGLRVRIGDEKALKKAGFKKGYPLVMMTHGYSRNYTNGGMEFLVAAYLDTRSEMNLISVDWSLLVESILPPPILNFASYFNGLKNIPRCSGGAMLPFIEFMIESGYVSGPESIHLIGHSLGAHVSGSTGFLVEKRLGKKIGRITGLDPAGPFMKLLKPKDRISARKASFVDNVHTQAEFFGTPTPLGHVDFYPNGGKGISQKECFEPDHIFPADNIPIYICPHVVGMNYYAQSIRGEKIFACPCRRSLLPDKIPCPKPKLNCKSPAIFGEHVSHKTRGKYYLTISR